MTRPRHEWTEPDNIIGFYLYRYGTEGLGMTESEFLSRLASAQGTTRISEGSMERKTRNYRFLDTGQPESGSNASEVSRKVYAQYKDASKTNLITVVRRILGL